MKVLLVVKVEVASNCPSYRAPGDKWKASPFVYSEKSVTGKVETCLVSHASHGPCEGVCLTCLSFLSPFSVPTSRLPAVMNANFVLWNRELWGVLTHGSHNTVFRHYRQIHNSGFFVVHSCINKAPMDIVRLNFLSFIRTASLLLQFTYTPYLILTSAVDRASLCELWTKRWYFMLCYKPCCGGKL